MASKVNSTAILLGIFGQDEDAVVKVMGFSSKSIFRKNCGMGSPAQVYAVWLDGRTVAAVAVATCGGNYDTEMGMINHPVMSGSYYNSNELCTWIISSSVPLFYYFSKFNMETDHDHLTIRDGSTIGSNEIENLSGKILDYNFTTLGSGHIQFESDENVVGTGFVLHWRILSAEDQCKAKKGFCVQTADKVKGVFEMIENSCDDRCACCIIDSEEDMVKTLTEGNL